MDKNLIEVRPTTQPGGISSQVSENGQPSQSLWISSNQELMIPDWDLTPWAMMLLPYAMRTDSTLRLHGSVDEVLLENLDRVQRVLNGWYPNRLSMIDVLPESTHRSVPANRSRAAFFSGGVDSFYTLSESSPPLDGILYVAGFDIPIDDAVRIERANRILRVAARDFGATAVEAASNVKSFTDEGAKPGTRWVYEQHGAAMAAVAYSLNPNFSSVKVASTNAGEFVHPMGTHPDLDHLWTSSVQTVEHDLSNTTRPEKVAAIMRFDVVRQNLRVCAQNKDDLNCGQCEKCIRTKINLRLTGNDGNCATLDRLSILDVQRLALSDKTNRNYAKENLKYLEDYGIDDPELEKALRFGIRRGWWIGLGVRVANSIPGARKSYRAIKKSLGMKPRDFIS